MIIFLCCGWNDWRVTNVSLCFALWLLRCEEYVFLCSWGESLNCVSLKMAELRVELGFWYVWHWMLHPEGLYWIVMTLAPDGTAGSNTLDGDNVGSTWCSWEVDSGWRCHTAAACGLWPCHPKPKHFTVLTHRISLVMHRHPHTYTQAHTGWPPNPCVCHSVFCCKLC